MVVVLLGCGGTISMKQHTAGYQPALHVLELLSQIPELKGFAELEIDEIMSEDSANIQPEDWITISKAIYIHAQRPEVEGIVVIHGTDTLVYTAAAAALMVQNLPIPVVFTGAQVPLSQVGSDGRKNLIDAIRVAKESPVAESIIVFDNKIMRGVRTLKLREYELDAFESVDSPPIGDIALKLHLLDSNYHSRKLGQPPLPLFMPYLEPNVALIQLYPGLKQESIETYIFESQNRGLVLESYGAGNVPIHKRSILNTLKKLHHSGIPVIVTTQCVWGRTEMMLYETGRQAYMTGAIPGFDMITPAALVKLMWVLGKMPKSNDLSDIEALIHTNFVGEISPEIIPRRDLV